MDEVELDFLDGVRLKRPSRLTRLTQSLCPRRFRDNSSTAENLPLFPLSNRVSCFGKYINLLNI